MSSSNNNNNSQTNGNNEKSINDNISQSTTTPTNVTRKKSTKKSPKKDSQNVNTSYEHHLEKWLENTAKMNFDYNTIDLNLPFLTTPSSYQQLPQNRNSNLQQYGSADPISLPSHFNSTLDTSPSISGFMNFNSSFKQQYPHLMYRQQSASPFSNDPLTSISTQQDFLSLPSMAALKNNDKMFPSTDQEKLNDVINQTRRLTDFFIDDTPRVMNASNNSARPNESSAEDELDDDNTDEEEKQPRSKMENGTNGIDLSNKTLIVSLLKQINLLHETNSKIFRNLHEQKVEMEALKYAPNWGLRHRRDSVSGMSVHSQPFGYAGGIASPAPTYHSQGNYTPGVVTDLIREVRDAGRIRDESLMNRAKALIEEKSWTINESNMRVLREVEEVKVHLHNLKLDRQTSNDRLNKLEDEVRSIKSFLGANIPYQQPMQYSQYPATSNSNLAMGSDQMKRNNMNLNFGVISNPSDNYQFDDHQTSNFHQKQRYTSHSQSSPKRHENSINEIDEDSFDGTHVIQLEKDTLKLRRDLQDALASKKQAETRILALEHMVTSLKTPTNTSYTNNSSNANKHSSSSSDFHQPQQHQLQIQINGGDANKRRTSMEHSVATGQMTGKLISPITAKASLVQLSAASGPVTDL